MPSSIGSIKTTKTKSTSKSNKPPTKSAKPSGTNVKNAPRSHETIKPVGKGKLNSSSAGATKNRTATSARAKAASLKVDAKAKNAKKNGFISSAFRTVSAVFTASKTEAVNLLKADHDKVEVLFKRVRSNEDGNNESTFKKIKQELDLHTHIEEIIFYPFLITNGDKELKKIVQEGIEEHRQAKMFLEELVGLKGDGDKFKAKIKVLMEDIDHHVKEEEREMFPMVRRQFDSKTLEELGAEMAAEKKTRSRKGGKAESKSTDE